MAFDKIDALKEQFDKELSAHTSKEELEHLRVKYLGRKSPIQELMKNLRDIPQDERPIFGKQVNDLKEAVSRSLSQKMENAQQAALKKQLETESVDVTLPGDRKTLGRKHPVQQTLDECVTILKEMGFSIHNTGEIEGEFYNYGGLNYPEDHPARDMQDTFYLSKEYLLRSHCTTIQQRIMEKENPPIRVASPGKCYRNETITSRSHVFFYQIDVFYVDKNVTFGDLLSTKEEFYSKFFNTNIKLRVRPSYFPFVEPGMEVDISCTNCNQKGCKLCKHTGWLEVAGAGMVHPEVLKQGGLNPDEFSGFAWGGGVERLCMLRHGIKDIRLFTENNMRFLSQFS